MALIQPLFVLFIVVAALALLWWGFSRLAILEPVRTALNVVVGLIVLLVLYELVTGTALFRGCGNGQ